MPLDAPPGLGPVRLRPIRVDDGPALVRYFEKLTVEDVRLRFFAPMRALTTRQLERFTHLDDARETALVLEAPEEGRDEILSVARLAVPPQEEGHAEFAISVRSDLKGRGFGRFMLRHLVGQARERGLKEIFGDILEENKAMLALAKELGFTLDLVADAPAIVRATLVL